MSAISALLRNVLNRMKSLSVVVLRASYGACCGVIIGCFLLFIPLGWIIVFVSVPLAYAIEYYHVNGVNPIWSACFLVLTGASGVLVFLMFAVTPFFFAPDDNEDERFSIMSNGFDFFFFLYGGFLTFSVIEIWLYYNYDHSIFKTGDVTVVWVILHVLDLTIRGFLQDLMELVGVKPVLEPSSTLWRAEIILKIVMAGTIVKVFTRYHDITRGKGGILPP